MASSIDLAVDTSALTAILLGEPEAPPLLSALNAAPRIGLCAPNRTALLAVIQVRLGDAGVERAEPLLQREQIRTISLDEALAGVAADAHRRFGKGRHAAGLDLGDGFSRALAVREQVPLLFEGDDFSKTDAVVARRRRV